MTVTIAQARLTLRDPHDCTDSNDELTLYQAFFDTLVKRVDQHFVSHLAESWEVSTDAQTWTFRLREGVRFHNGSACDAVAVVQSLKRLARPDKGYTLGAPGVWHQYLGDAEIVAEGSHDLRITLTAPMADLLDVLVQCFVVAPASIVALEAGDAQAPVGSGPYRAVAVSPDEILAERVDGHFAGTPANAQVRWLHEPDQTARLAMLMDGRAQVSNTLDFEASRALDWVGNTRLRCLAPVAVIYLLNASKGALTDARVRRALALALDREALIEDIMKGAAEPLWGFVSPQHFGAGGRGAAQRNPDLARALLAEAGHADGLTLQVDCPTRLPDESVELTAAMARQLSEVGITLEVHYHEDREGYAHMVRRKEIRDLCVFDSSPMSTYRVLYEKLDARVAGSWWQGYHNPQVEGLIDQGRRETDEIKRASIYQEAFAELQRDPAWLTLYNPLRVLGLAGEHPDFRLPVDGVIDVAALPDLTGGVSG